jgi:hypothetical protein
MQSWELSTMTAEGSGAVETADPSRTVAVVDSIRDAS